MKREKLETSDPNFSIDVYDKKFTIISYDDKLTINKLRKLKIRADMAQKQKGAGEMEKSIN